MISASTCTLCFSHHHAALCAKVGGRRDGEGTKQIQSVPLLSGPLLPGFAESRREQMSLQIEHKVKAIKALAVQAIISTDCITVKYKVGKLVPIESSIEQSNFKEVQGGMGGTHRCASGEATRG